MACQENIPYEADQRNFVEFFSIFGAFMRLGPGFVTRPAKLINS
jgi:hypothetical protein